MAYYDDGYIWAQEHTTFYPLAYQDPVSVSSYEPYGHVDPNYDAYNVSVFHEPNFIDLSAYGYGYDYGNGYDYGDSDNWYASSSPCINYLANNFMEPKLIVYEPVECDMGYVSCHTQYSISYSKVEPGFNEPEFEEYDPTPYGGGYDIISTYGKPLPPSDLTCYPRSKPKPIGSRPEPNSVGPRPTPNSESQPQTKARPEPKLMHVPIANPVPLVEPKPEPKPKPQPMPELAPKPLESKEVGQTEPRPEPKPKPKLQPMPEPVPKPLGSKEIGQREKEEYGYPGYGYDYPWPEYDNAQVGYDYGYGRQVVQIPPCEYSPEVVDLCESIFGSWPCLARIRKQQMDIPVSPRISGSKNRQLNPFEECASYFFGRPMGSYNV